MVTTGICAQLVARVPRSCNGQITTRHVAASITITWTVEPVEIIVTDVPAVTEIRLRYTVSPAPNPVITIPNLQGGSLTCEAVAATYYTPEC